MSIEKEIFKKSKILYDKLIPYGFKIENDKYIISKNILNNTFQIKVEIENDSIIGKVYDLEFGEEYTNYRLNNQSGEFSSIVSDEFKNFLIDIKNHCTLSKYFVFDQSNRITNYVIKKYNSNPEFLWNSSPGHGVFRNLENNKWYGIIMYINRKVIDKKDEDVEVLNIKLDSHEITELLCIKGYYPAYHMNKKNWISIILDDTLDDKTICDLIDKSYILTK